MLRRSFSIVALFAILACSAFAMGIHNHQYYLQEFALGNAAFSPVDEVALGQIEAMASSQNANVHRVTRTLDIYLISWKPDIDDEIWNDAIRSGDIDTKMKLHRSAEPEVREWVATLVRSGLVKWACPNYYRYIQYTPDDPFFPDDGDHTPSSGPDQFDKAMIHCPAAWETQRGSENIIIAIIDSGTDIDHPDLTANIWVNPGEDLDGDGVVYDLGDIDGSDNDYNGYIDDLFGYDFVGGVTGEETSPPDQEDWNPDIHYSGDDGWGEPDPSVGNGEGGFPFFGIPPDQGVAHGTHCSGVAAAVMDNETMFAGVAGGGCKIMPVRVGNPEGSMTVTDIAAGIEYAAIAGANVISMSLGGFSSESEPVESTAIEFAHSMGVTIVAASGNSAGMPYFGNDTCGYPSSDPLVIAVGSCDAAGNRASFSQYGSMLDVVAPGGATNTSGDVVETIWSTYVVSVADADEDPTLSPGDHNYMHAEGTSMACPQAAGVCGLILSQDPTLTNIEVRQILRDSAEDVMSPGFDLESGYGRIDAASAVELADIDERAILPMESAIDVFPNPFNSAVTINLDFGSESPKALSTLLPGACRVEIFDIAGRMVYEIPVGAYRIRPENGSTQLTPTVSEIVWQPEKSVTSGVYLVRAKIGNKNITKRVVYLK